MQVETSLPPFNHILFVSDEGPREFLSDEELSQLTESELDDYIKEMEDWLKQDLKSVLNPNFFPLSPVGNRQCAAENCDTMEFRRTGYSLDHRDTKFFDKFEVGTPGIGHTALIAKKSMKVIIAVKQRWSALVYLSAFQSMKRQSGCYLIP